MSYTNPFPALKEYMRRMREISNDRYEDGYESTSSSDGGGNSPPRSGRARRHPDDGSDSDDEYYPVNPYLQRARAEVLANEADSTESDATIRIGISKTPKKGLACPTCRTQPIVDATGSCLVTSMVELVQKVSSAESVKFWTDPLITAEQHRPDLVRSENEMAQAQKVYKKGDKLSVRLRLFVLSILTTDTPMYSFRFHRHPRLAALAMLVTTLPVILSPLAARYQQQVQGHQPSWEKYWLPWRGVEPTVEAVETTGVLAIIALLPETTNHLTDMSARCQLVTRMSIIRSRLIALVFVADCC